MKARDGAASPLFSSTIDRYVKNHKSLKDGGTKKANMKAILTELEEKDFV